MSFLLGRDGKISILRVGLLAVFLASLLLIGAFISVNIDQASRRGPFDVALYPGAEEWGTSGAAARGNMSRFYRVPGVTPEDVVAFYQERINEFYGNDPTEPNSVCRRFPETGDFSNYIPGQGLERYRFHCVFDNSSTGFNALLQITEIIIQPGEPNADPFLNAEGMTVIEYRQQWTP